MAGAQQKTSAKQHDAWGIFQNQLHQQSLTPSSHMVFSSTAQHYFLLRLPTAHAQSSSIGLYLILVLKSALCCLLLPVGLWLQKSVPQLVAVTLSFCSLFSLYLFALRQEPALRLEAQPTQPMAAHGPAQPALQPPPAPHH